MKSLHKLISKVIDDCFYLNWETISIAACKDKMFDDLRKHITIFQADHTLDRATRFHLGEEKMRKHLDYMIAKSIADRIVESGLLIHEEIRIGNSAIIRTTVPILNLKGFEIESTEEKKNA